MPYNLRSMSLNKLQLFCLSILCVVALLSIFVLHNPFGVEGENNDDVITPADDKAGNAEIIC